MTERNGRKHRSCRIDRKYHTDLFSSEEIIQVSDNKKMMDNLNLGASGSPLATVQAPCSVSSCATASATGLESLNKLQVSVCLSKFNLQGISFHFPESYA